MGFKLERTYALRWDGDLAGLEVDIRGTSVAVMQEIRGLRVSAEGTEVLRLAEILAAHIKRWNFEGDDGETLPITAESILAQEASVVSAIGREWYLAAAGVSAPLDLKSTDSPPSVEPSIPMEAL